MNENQSTKDDHGGVNDNINLQMYFHQSIIINHGYLNLKSSNLLNTFHIKYSKKLKYHAMIFPKKIYLQCLIKALNF